VTAAAACRLSQCAAQAGIPCGHPPHQFLFHSATLHKNYSKDRKERPAPAPRRPRHALSFNELPPLGNFRPIPFLPQAPARGIRTGSLALHRGRREILALFGTRALPRNSATYTEICAPVLSITFYKETSLWAGRPPTPHNICEGERPAGPTQIWNLGAAPVRLVSCNTLLSGCPLSRPPPSCPHEPTPFPRGPSDAFRSRAVQSALHDLLTRPCPLAPQPGAPSRFDAACRNTPTLAPSVTYGAQRPGAAFLREISEGTSN